MADDKIAKLGNPEDLVNGILTGDMSEEFSFRRVRPGEDVTDYPVRVRLLSMEEMQIALSEAHKRAKKRGGGEVSDDVYREEQAVQLVWRSLCHPEMGELKDGSRVTRRLFPDPEKLINAFTPAEIAQCINMYELVKAKFGAIETFSEEEVEWWIKHLAGVMGERGYLFLSRLNLEDWPNLMVCIARVAFQTLSSSQPSLEYDQEISDPDTTDSFTLPSSQSSNGIVLPTDHHPLTDAEARELAKKFGK